MLSQKEILETAEKFVREIEDEIQIDLSIIYENTIKKAYGNIFFYVKKKYYQTKDEKYNTLAGNAAFLVVTENGKIIEFGTGQPTSYYIKEYEEGRWPENRSSI